MAPSRQRDEAWRWDNWRSALITRKNAAADRWDCRETLSSNRCLLLSEWLSECVWYLKSILVPDTGFFWLHSYTSIISCLCSVNSDQPSIYWMTNHNKSDLTATVHVNTGAHLTFVRFKCRFQVWNQPISFTVSKKHQKSVDVKYKHHVKARWWMQLWVFIHSMKSTFKSLSALHCVWDMVCLPSVRLHTATCTRVFV